MRLIAPVDAGTFVRDHWEQRPLRIARGDPGFHDGLLSLADLDGLLSHASIRAPDIRILRDGKETPVRELTGEAQNAHVGRLEAVYAAYRDGATISMQALNERHPPLAALCRSLALELSARFQVNAYLTPADARGLSIHYDTHDVFVLQVEGSKRWHLYDSPVRLPTRRQPFRRGDADLGAPVESFVLERGDTLYLPRGVVHSAESGSATSLHLTVGAYPVTWAGLLRGALEAAIEEDAALRQSLPPGFALRPAERAAAERRLGELIRGLAARWDAPTLIGEAAETALGAAAPSLEGHLLDLEAAAALTPATRLRRRPALAFRIFEQEGAACLAFHGKLLRLPGDLAAELRFMLAGRPFTAAGLPGPLDAEGRLVLVRRLLREGALTLCRDPAGDGVEDSDPGRRRGIASARRRR